MELETENHSKMNSENKNQPAETDSENRKRKALKVIMLSYQQHLQKSLFKK